MINRIYQLIRPKFIEIKYDDLIYNNNSVLIRPESMALCNADQRYYQGKRDPIKLAAKLPMALIHECCGKVVLDNTGTYKIGQKVLLIPNQPPHNSHNGYFENYMQGTKFLSSGYDGFMQEIVSMKVDRIVPYTNIDSDVAAIGEFISVCMHAFNRFNLSANFDRDRIVVIGDGSLAYTMASVVKYKLPNTKLIILGKHIDKLQLFTFADEVYQINAIPQSFEFNHAFECCGGVGSGYAVNDLIKYIKPQGSIVLMGVSEETVPLNTRDILEKGLTLIGSSRSGYEDFIDTVNFLEEERNQRQMRKIINFLGDIKNIDDIHSVFREDLSTPFKSVFNWRV